MSHTSRARAAAILAVLALTCAAQAAPPAWDARGTGLPPRQAPACLDASDDGRFLAVGTVSPPGDRNVLLLDANGKLLAQHRAGLRWINEVAVSNDGRFVSALCTTPEGTAGDSPRLVAFLDGRQVASAGAGFRLADSRGEGCLFHYGDHSNHLPPTTARAGRLWVVVGDDKVRWLTPSEAGADRAVGLGAGRTLAFAAGAGGRVAVGRLGEADTPSAPGLIVVDPNSARPVWVRPVLQDASAAPRPEEGVYGPAAGPWEDARLYAPLAVAVDDRTGGVASADYQGWQRRLTGRGEPVPIGLRFMPSRPTIHVHDAKGALIRRIAPETFAEPFWADLAFVAGGMELLVWPHNWTSRGLGGSGFLPADAEARTVYRIALATGEVVSARLPEAVASVSAGADGKLVAVGCWDGRVHLLDERLRPLASLPRGADVGAACLVKASRDGRRIAAAGADGVVHVLDAGGRELWRADLNRLVPPPAPPRKPAKADLLAPGIWRTNGNLAHSDMGAQMVVEAPDGLILIDCNAGASFEQNWARILAAGLDPMKVRYVLLTHEHGDHAPGAYLWRLATGAQVVAGAQTAYILRHHVPGGTGYGFHPPTPTDVVIREDTDLTLAGLKVRALRLPGHTFGSTGWAFEKGGKVYVATGDLIMPRGVLGYSGSMDFSAADVLASLRKLRDLAPDVILGGHGGGQGSELLDTAIRTGLATGWGKMTPEKPNPLFGFQRTNYLVVAWLAAIRSFACGDLDGDGRADLAVLTAAGRGASVDVYFNRGGAFADKPDGRIALAGLDRPWKLRTADLNGDKVADLVASSESAAFAMVSRDGRADWRIEPLEGVLRGTQFLAWPGAPGAARGMIIGSRFVSGHVVALPQADGTFRTRRAKAPDRMYFDLAAADVNADGREDLLASCGDVLMGGPDGQLAETPAIILKPPDGEPARWAFLAVGDFNADTRPDAALLANTGDGAIVRLFLNTGRAGGPFPDRPVEFTVAATVLRDGPTVADYDADGLADLILAAKDNRGACILRGGRDDGLSPKRLLNVELDFTVHHDTKLVVADLNADARPDLAAFGTSPAGAPGVYIHLQAAGK